MQHQSVEGSVIEILPNSLYKVSLEGGREVLCYVAGKMKLNRIRVLVGDTVKVVLDPYRGKATNRIIERLPL